MTDAGREKDKGKGPVRLCHSFNWVQNEGCEICQEQV